MHRVRRDAFRLHFTPLNLHVIAHGDAKDGETRREEKVGASKDEWGQIVAARRNMLGAAKVPARRTCAFWRIISNVVDHIA